MAEREARNGTLILGGGFAGSYVGRYLGKLVPQETLLWQDPETWGGLKERPELHAAV